MLPPNLKVLVFGRGFNKEFEKNVLPDNLQILNLDRYTHVIKKNILPTNLKILLMTTNMNIDKYPQHLKKIVLTNPELRKFGSTKPIFNLSVLPENIEFLDLKIFEGSLSNFIFQKLKILKIMSRNFNILTWLPETLKYIEIYSSTTDWNDEEEAYYFESVNYKIFPSSLEYLILGKNKITFENNENSDNDNITLFQEKLQNLNYLSIDGHTDQLNILNNLPVNLSVIKFTKLETMIDNLPTNLKEIYLEDNSQRKYIKKVPYDCNIIISDAEIEIVDNYLINSTYTQTKPHPDSILNNLINLDDIGIQYYSTY